ncbi:hypothetical protein, partial [uncultured Prevotella sp.]|uniref:hypothetical protein n=1 Tax=uncultured Prevotella sp. TaxID=159272 RepID=UPI00266CA56B
FPVLIRALRAVLFDRYHHLGNGCRKWERLWERLRKNISFFFFILLQNLPTFTPRKDGKLCFLHRRMENDTKRCYQT